VKFAKAIPSFVLYGEAASPAGRTDAVHIEDIPTRSRKYLWRIASHRHAGQGQCVYITLGAVRVELEGVRRDLQAPALIVVPAGTVHGFRFRSDTQGYVLTVDMQRLMDLAPSAQQAPIAGLFSLARELDLSASPALSARVEPLLERLLQEFRQPESLHAPISGWLACSVLWLFASGTRAASATFTANSQDAERLRRFRQLIEDRYLRHWPVARYARQLNLSEASLNRLCRRLAGTTAFELLQERLALEARRRLLYVGGSVAAIGRELGFDDPAYFCRFFRRRMGVSPSAFRRRPVDGKETS
jgi:AraC family transcriptional activator of pobA